MAFDYKMDFCFGFVNFIYSAPKSPVSRQMELFRLPSNTRVLGNCRRKSSRVVHLIPKCLKSVPFAPFYSSSYKRFSCGKNFQVGISPLSSSPNVWGLNSAIVAYDRATRAGFGHFQLNQECITINHQNSPKESSSGRLQFTLCTQIGPEATKASLVSRAFRLSSKVSK